MSEMNKIFKELDIVELSPGYQKNVEVWESWYQGDVAGFHKYKESNGKKNVTRERYTLGMAKKVCEDWADTLFNPETEITVDESKQEELDLMLEERKFNAKINELIERAYGLGTGAVTITNIDGQAELSYISVEMLRPITIDKHNAWLVMSELNKETIYLSIHHEEQKGIFQVDNKIVEVKDDEYKLLDDATVESEYNMDTTVENAYPTIAIIKPALANNVEYGTKYGLSIFANAISELKGVDIAYSGTQSEINVGKLRVFTQEGNLDSIDGSPKFDDTEGFYILEGDNTFEDGTTVKTHSPTLRTDAYIDTLNTNLNLLGRKCGFGDNSYSFDEGSIYTNTSQVVSSNSKFYKTRQKHLEIIEDALLIIIKAMLSIDTEYTGDITVDFDDSIIEDNEQTFERNMMLLNGGYISRQEFFMRTEGLTEKQAQVLVDKQNKDNNIVEEVELEGEIDEVVDE